MNPGFGGAVDSGSHAAFRLSQMHYLPTRFSASRQANLRLSAGMVLRFGKK